jgi:hypothetical protein
MHKHRSLFTVPIDRTTIFGNPFKIGIDGCRQDVIGKHRVYFINRLAKDERFRKAVEALRNKQLGCWCKPLLCHGDIIKDYLNGKKNL